MRVVCVCMCVVCVCACGVCVFVCVCAGCGVCPCMKYGMIRSSPSPHPLPPLPHPPHPPPTPPPVSGELSALQEEGEKEQKFADDPNLELDMKVRQQLTECVEVEVTGVLLVQSTLSCEWCVLGTAHFSSLYCRLCGLTQQMQCHIVQPLPTVLCHLTDPP